ncbi:acyl carrier protein [Lactobacillus sp. CBA3606]|uniref:acyl carrier protein n=1 Tax=unclassified Lactobacillus TaxID=2620435 RepID=UPI000CFD5817|nr:MULTISPECIES: acyl carrier protein [unclassified Lactobacillus]AVK60306.1 acyl carrier protein [Lactobacillus sp. CBA3605]AVK62954.1 acyl carrier protein [Lactobacillus sp. CBA3606]
MTKEEIFNKIAAIIADRFEVDQSKVTMEMNLQQDLDADSIDFVEFVLELEDTFGSEISDEDAEKLNTVGEVVDYVAARQAK